MAKQEKVKLEKTKLELLEKELEKLDMVNRAKEQANEIILQEAEKTVVGEAITKELSRATNEYRMLNSYYKTLKTINDYIQSKEADNSVCEIFNEEFKDGNY